MQHKKLWTGTIFKEKVLEHEDQGGVATVEDSPNQITGFWSGTQAEYDAIATPTETVVYFVTPNP